jgi:hypothetical protein
LQSGTRRFGSTLSRSAIGWEDYNIRSNVSSLETVFLIVSIQCSPPLRCAASTVLSRATERRATANIGGVRI